MGIVNKESPPSGLIAFADFSLAENKDTRSGSMGVVLFSGEARSWFSWTKQRRTTEGVYLALTDIAQ